MDQFSMNGPKISVQEGPLLHNFWSFGPKFTAYQNFLTCTHKWMHYEQNQHYTTYILSPDIILSNTENSDSFNTLSGVDTENYVRG